METKDVLEHPVVKELMELSKDGIPTLDGLIPHIEKDLVCISPGWWNERTWTAEEIQKSFENTDWSDRYSYAVYADHVDKSTKYWLGDMKNIRMDKGGVMKADFHCYDFDTAIKLKYGKMKSGISIKADGNDDGFSMRDFVIKNFSHVVTPADKTAYIFNSDVGGIFYKHDRTEKQIAELIELESTRKKMNKDVAEFYAMPRDPPSESKFPIYDEAHIRSTLIMFDKAEGVSDIEKAKAIKNIEAAAKKFNITIGGKNMTEEVKKDKVKPEGTEETKEEKPESGEENEVEEKTKEGSSTIDNTEKELEDFKTFFKEFKAKNPDATIADAMAAFKKKSGATENSDPVEPKKEENTGEPETIENLDLKGLSKEDAIKTLSETIENLKSDKIKLAERESAELNEMKKTVREMAEEIKTIKEDSNSPDRLGVVATAELSDNALDRKSDYEMLAFLKKGLI